MRAPVVGGSELETLTIVRDVDTVRHRVIHPARFRDLGPSIRDRFPPSVEVLAVDDVEAAIEADRPALLHIQFPFILAPAPHALASVLELTCIPRVPTLFTVHAAVNVPVVPDIHYLFHTERQYASFAERIPRERVTIAGSLVVPPSAPRRPRKQGDRVVVLWVSRNEDAKFHPQIADICRTVLDACQAVEFRFVGRPERVPLPDDERVSIVDCPAPDLAAEYERADLFWAFPHPLLEETWCRVVTEALGHGLPAVVAAHGAPSFQVVDGVHGCVVDSPAACARALVELVRRPDLRRRLGAAAVERGWRLYDESRRNLVALYDRLLLRTGTHATAKR